MDLLSILKNLVFYTGVGKNFKVSGSVRFYQSLLSIDLPTRYQKKETYSVFEILSSLVGTGLTSKMIKKRLDRYSKFIKFIAHFKCT